MTYKEMCANANRLAKCNHEKFKLTFSITAGFLIPINLIINEIKSFCCENDVECNVFSAGFLVKKAEFVIKGEMQTEKINVFERKMRNYLNYINSL